MSPTRPIPDVGREDARRAPRATSSCRSRSRRAADTSSPDVDRRGRGRRSAGRRSRRSSTRSSGRSRRCRRSADSVSVAVVTSASEGQRGVDRERAPAGRRCSPATRHDRHGDQQRIRGEGTATVIGNIGASTNEKTIAITAATSDSTIACAARPTSTIAVRRADRLQHREVVRLRSKADM